jgi:GH25 family lysozyme M1 (1,4-beta-N-acetylmuramidase)
MTIVSDMTVLARGEVGYHEGRSNGHWNNFEKYAPAVPGLEWAQNQAWCATFVSWLAMKAGAAKLFPRTASCEAGVAWFKKAGRFSQYPGIGAQVFYGPGGGEHTGFVVGYDDTYVYTVEGNTNDNGSAEGDGVYAKSRIRHSDHIYGYGYPKFPEGIKNADPKFAAENPKPSAPAPVPAPPAPVKAVQGIDVSSHQDAAYSLAGADFVVVKATEGTDYVNPKRAAQVQRARDAKVVVGHYHFMRPGSVQAQADFFLKTAAPLPGEFLALDWEDPGVSCADKDAFLRYVQSKAGGRKVVLYCNTAFWLHRDTSSFAADGLWIAQYGVGAGKPAIQAAWLMHQYTDAPQDTSVTRWSSRADMAKWAASPAPAPAPKPKPKPVPKPVKPKPAPKPAPKHKAYVPPAFPAGLKPGSSKPSAKPLQRALKAAGFMNKSVPESDTYGPKTQLGVALFLNKHPELRSRDWPEGLGGALPPGLRQVRRKVPNGLRT